MTYSPKGVLGNTTMGIEDILQQHSGGVLILVLTAMLLTVLLIIIPQLLRSQQRSLEFQHNERMRALEQGQELPQTNDLVCYAGRIAILVPIVALCAAGTVTCFLVVYRKDDLFALVLTVWSVAGIVGFGCVTACITLMHRLANPDEEFGEEQPPQDVDGKAHRV